MEVKNNKIIFIFFQDHHVFFESALMFLELTLKTKHLWQIRKLTQKYSSHERAFQNLYFVPIFFTTICESNDNRKASCLSSSWLFPSAHHHLGIKQVIILKTSTIYTVKYSHHRGKKWMYITCELTFLSIEMSIHKILQFFVGFS